MEKNHKICLSGIRWKNGLNELFLNEFAFLVCLGDVYTPISVDADKINKVKVNQVHSSAIFSALFVALNHAQMFLGQCFGLRLMSQMILDTFPVGTLYGSCWISEALLMKRVDVN